MNWNKVKLTELSSNCINGLHYECDVCGCICHKPEIRVE